MTVTQIHPQANAEFASKITHYENARRGWGGLRRKEALSTDRQIAAFPRLVRLGSHGSRRSVTPQFLFPVQYEITAYHIFVLAISHPSRVPRYWQSRHFP
ncbi:MAG: hypothetical protein CK548_00115 [Opitutia bacterium]|nr:MAG: hypothetical protein CK548_00115 [Opitutae bacterium]